MPFEFQEEYEARRAKDEELKALRDEKEKVDFQLALQKSREDAKEAARKAHDEAIETIKRTISAGEAERNILVAENARLQEEKLQMQTEMQEVSKYHNA